MAAGKRLSIVSAGRAAESQGLPHIWSSIL